MLVVLACPIPFLWDYYGGLAVARLSSIGKRFTQTSEYYHPGYES